jgi:hypothetical protein
VTDAELAVVVDDPQRAERVVAGLVDDGLVVRCNGHISLPDDLPPFSGRECTP